MANGWIIDEWLYWWVDGWMDRWVNGLMGGWRMDECMDGWQ